MQNNEILYYRRWDDRSFKIEYEKNGIICNVIVAEPVEDRTYDQVKHDSNSYSFSDIKFILGEQPDGKDYDFIQLQKGKESSDKLWFYRNDFLQRIEFNNNKIGLPANIIWVESIEEYITAVEAYRFLSFMARIKKTALKLLAYSKREKIGSIQKIAYDIINILDNRSEIKSIHANDIGANLSDRIENAVEVLDDCIKECIKTECDYDHIAKEFVIAIKQSIQSFKKGESFQYYRGVGHTVYPEIPGVLRGNNRFHEDKYYRKAKTIHPDELTGLCYLDRLAKIQHYGWPTRLLDVSSNPLAALYMACNTVYNLDDKQMKDMGEVIIYFNDDDLIEKSYDSKAVLINAALVKLSYEERKAMFEFINMHNMLFRYGNDVLKKLGNEEDLKKAINYCLHIAVDRGSDTIMKPYEVEYIKSCVCHSSFSNDLILTPGTCAYRFLSKTEIEKDNKQVHYYGIRKCAYKEDQRLRFYIPGEKEQSADSDIKRIRYEKAFSVENDEKEYLNLFNYFVKAYDKLLVTIRRENSAFQNKIDIFQMIKSYHVRVGMSNDRILAQGGSFLIVGVDDKYIGNEMNSSRKPSNMRIIIKNKAKIMKQLNYLSINDATMLPDLQHTGDYMRKMLG